MAQPEIQTAGTYQKAPELARQLVAAGQNRVVLRGGNGELIYILTTGPRSVGAGVIRTDNHLGVNPRITEYEAILGMARLVSACEQAGLPYNHDVADAIAADQEALREVIGFLEGLRK